MRPARKARGGRIPGVSNRRATPRPGMQRRPNVTGLRGCDTGVEYTSNHFLTLHSGLESRQQLISISWWIVVAGTWATASSPPTSRKDHVWNRCSCLEAPWDQARASRPRHAPTPAPRPGRAARLGLARCSRRTRTRAAEHHRPDDRRSADRQRGRAAPHRRQRRVLRLRADPLRAGARGARVPDAVGQRDRAAPVRGSRRACAALTARRVRVRDLGRAGWAAVRGARPVRHQAALLHGA